MGIEFGFGQQTDLRLQDILEKAKTKYLPEIGDDEAYFVYVSPSDKTPYTMTLEQAMYVCGNQIGPKSDAEIWTFLDAWNERAKLLKAEKADFLEYSKQLGQQALVAALAKRNITVGNDGGEAQ